jgi:RecJ-like exonuclease
MAVKIFSHGDADGICAASLITSVYPDCEIWITSPVGLLKDLKETEAGDVFICDVAISERDKKELFEEFARIREKGRITYIDHHPLPLGIMRADVPASRVITSSLKSTSELTYQMLQDNLPKTMDRVALFGAISDYCDETEFVLRSLDIYDKRTIYFEAGLLSQCLGAVKGDYPFKKEIIRHLAEGELPSEINEVVKMAIKATKKEWKLYNYVDKKVSIHNGIAVVSDVPQGLSPTKAAKFAMGITGSRIGVSTKSRNKHVDVSVRKRRDFPLDLNRTLRNIALRFNGTGGGHPNAAGARIPQENLNNFIEFLAREVSSIS